ncbi:MAG: glycoside hydrolase family 4 [Planctomycetota bacterium]
MKGPKVVVLGAGSLFFGRQALWSMLNSEVLREGTLALVDTDPERQDKMMRLARIAIDAARSPLKLEGSTDRREVLKGADFVVLTFAARGVSFRGVDVETSAKYGIRMCGGDSIGPGGIFRTLRGLPQVARAVADVRDLCPNAWVLNYINPTATIGIWLARHGGVRAMALCDGHPMPYVKRRYMLWSGIIPDMEASTPEMEDALDLRIAGVNHFTWMLSMKYRGRDVMQELRRHIESLAKDEKDEGYSKTRFKHSCSLELWDVFGAYPTLTSHTKEYVRYWQAPGVAKGRIPPLTLFSPAERQLRHDEMWRQVDGIVSGAAKPETFQAAFDRPDMATDIIESMWARRGRRFYVNTPNQGAVTNLPDDSVLELLCDLDMEGVRPLPVGAMPVGLRALQQQVLDTHELAAEAAVRHDRTLLRRAMLTDPLARTIPDADAIIAELLARERDALPPEWFSP